MKTSSTKAKGSTNLIGARVKKLRRDLGMLQKDLADAMVQRGLDVDRLTVVRLEGHQRHVSDTELVALANIFGTTPNHLLDYTIGAPAKKRSPRSKR